LTRGQLRGAKGKGLAARSAKKPELKRAESQRPDGLHAMTEEEPWSTEAATEGEEKKAIENNSLSKRGNNEERAYRRVPSRLHVPEEERRIGSEINRVGEWKEIDIPHKTRNRINQGPLLCQLGGRKGGG